MASRSGLSALSSSSGLAAGPASDSDGAVRPRNRRLISIEDGNGGNSKNRTSSIGRSGLLSDFEASSQPRPQPSRHRANAGYGGGGGGGGGSGSGSSGNATISQFLGESFTQSWSSVQGLATSFLGSGAKDSRNKGSPYRGRLSNSRAPAGSDRVETLKWGPEPAPKLSDVAAGSLAEREATLKAAKTASVLESHDGVNGRLDVSGRHKRRTSDEIPTAEQLPDSSLVYIHHVQQSDTYAGIILRYRCREDAFRKANGLWSRDSIQTRKFLTLPVDACEVRGVPCDGPGSKDPQQQDLLAPSAATSSKPKPDHDECYSSISDTGSISAQQTEHDSRPWSHVRWVQIDSFEAPVEVGRVSRQAMGYFPPRRKKSIRSLLSTPRQSSDFSVGLSAHSDDQATRRRQSSLSGQPRLSPMPVSSCGRGGGSEAADAKPAWMRRPGGVGTMGRNIRAPGPEKDPLNAWANKHFPGLNIDQLPSMSVMGSEIARFGFGGDGGSIVEKTFEEGRNDATALNRQGTGLDRAAAAVETWLRGALAKRPTTPLLRPRTKGAANFDNDLIELTDTGSDDGRFGQQDVVGGLLEPLSVSGSSGQRVQSGTVTMRGGGGAGVGNGKGKKED